MCTSEFDDWVYIVSVTAWLMGSRAVLYYCDDIMCGQVRAPVPVMDLINLAVTRLTYVRLV